MSAELLAFAGERMCRSAGTLNTTAQVAGTVGDPHITADLRLTKGAIYGEPYDSGDRARAVRERRRADCDGGAGRGAKASQRYGTFRPRRRRFTAGKLTFNVSSNAMALNQIALLEANVSRSLGTAQFKADGAIEIEPANQRRVCSI